MRWVDVAGPPGVGKSALVDLWWPPNSIKADGLPPQKQWAEFIAYAYALLERCRGHAKHERVESLLGRSIAKMATVARMSEEWVYIQTGFAQRGLDLAMMLGSGMAAREYFELMPVSSGVALLTADPETIKKRNAERPKEDRSWMVDGMLLGHETALEVLKARAVNVIEIDTREPIEDNRAKLLSLT